MEVTQSHSFDDLVHIQPDLNRAYAESRMRDGMTFTAHADGKVVGFLIYNFWWGNTPFIELIKVLPSHHRSGAGTAMLDAAKNVIKAKGFKKLVSSTEHINAMGLGFHDKSGFKDVGSLQLPHGAEKFYVIEL